MRRLLVLCVALPVLAAAPQGQTWRAPRTEAERRLPRLLRFSPGELEHAEKIVFPQWKGAVERHAPGEPDLAAAEISGWSGEDLDAVLKWVLFQFTADDNARHKRALLPRDSLAAFVRRGALLHADIALLVPPDPSRLPSVLPSSPTRYFIIQFSDGREQYGFHAGIHLEVGRALLALVTRKEWRDTEFDSLWYAATTASLLRVGALGYAEPHVKAGLEALPNDARLLFLGGALHEAFAAPPIQHGVETSKMPAGFQWSVASSRAELEEAENLLARSLRIDPTNPEVHLHHARVAGQLGRHTDAAAELAALQGRLNDPVLQYYAEMFRGDDQAALGHRDAARAAFERAAVLFPGAQSPLIAVSRLSRGHGDRAGAVTALRRVFALPTDEYERLDPWWTYYQSHVRNAEALMASLRARSMRETTP